MAGVLLSHRTATYSFSHSGTEANVNLTVNITNNIIQPSGNAARPSSTAATTVTTSVAHGSCALSRQLVTHTTMASDTPHNLQQLRSQAPPPIPPEREITLSEEQENILNLVRRRKNVFFTGAAGTGKSVLLREIIKVLLNMYDPTQVAITAPTGVAGLNIGGSTIHSWAGIGYGKESAERLLKGLSSSKKLQWRSTKALIIDEISMLDGNLFDKLEYIARMVRREDDLPRGSSDPFGGIQLIISGDFFQLPPVSDKDSSTSIPALFAFEAQCWSRCIDFMGELSKVFRQKDNKFIDMLSAMRVGKLERWHVEEFYKLSRPLHYEDGIEPTQLFPRKGDVERYNHERLHTLPGEAYTFRAMDSYGRDINDTPIDPHIGGQLLERLVVAKVVTLKVGAQVMLLRNQPEGGLVNGSLGKVIEFITVREARDQFLSIADMSKRETSVNQLTTNTIHGFGKDNVFPLVKFTNEKLLLCAPTDFTVENIKGGVEARRIQIPLALSYAMSIHKSQGQTLSRVRVDLGRIFEKGQAYVALSRATSMEGLEILNFQPGKVTAHPKVLEWWNKLHNQRRSDVNKTDDAQDWTVEEKMDEWVEGRIDDEMDQDFVIERYFGDMPE